MGVIAPLLSIHMANLAVLIIPVNVHDDSRKRKQNDNQPPKPFNKEQKKKATDDYHYDKFRKQFRKH